MKKIKEDIGCGIALDVTGILIWIFSMSIRKMKTATYDISSAVFPRICGTLLLLLGLVLIVGGIYRIKAMEKNSEPEFAPDAEAPDDRKRGLIRILIVLAVFVLFIVLLPLLGFIISGILLQFALMVIMAPPQERTPPKMALYFAVAVVAAVLVDLLFVRVFRLMLPPGLLSF